MEEPPSKDTIGKNDSTTPVKERDWLIWLKNFDFMKYIIVVMMLIYIVDLFFTKGTSSLREPLFETLKTLLFMAAGYVFAKSSD